MDLVHVCDVGKTMPSAFSDNGERPMGEYTLRGELESFPISSLVYHL